MKLARDGSQPRCAKIRGRRGRPGSAAARCPVPDDRRRPSEGGRASGLTPRDVILQTVAALNSSVSIDRNFWIDVKSGNQYFVAVQYPDNPGMKLEDVLNIVATGTNSPTR